MGDRLLPTREIGRQESRRYQAPPYPVRGVPAVTAESAVRIETLGQPASRMALTAGLSSIRCAGGIDDIDFLLPNVDDALERLAHATTVKGYLPRIRSRRSFRRLRFQEASIATSVHCRVHFSDLSVFSFECGL